MLRLTPPNSDTELGAPGLGAGRFPMDRKTLGVRARRSFSQTFFLSKGRLPSLGRRPSRSALPCAHEVPADCALVDCVSSFFISPARGLQLALVRRARVRRNNMLDRCSSSYELGFQSARVSSTRESYLLG